MGRLSKMLQNTRRGGQGFGFTAQPTETRASLAVVAALAEPRQDLIKAAIEGGADAVVLAQPSGGDSVKVAELKQLIRAAADKPCGLAVADLKPDEAFEPKAWLEAGLDFVVFTTDRPASVLLSEAERVARVDAGFEPADVRALDGLGVDAFIVAAEQRPAGSRLSVSEVVRFRLLAGLTGKPVLVSVRDEALAADLEVLAQIGLEGIVLEESLLGASAEGLRAHLATFREAVRNLGPRRAIRRRPGEEVPLLPRVGPTAMPEQEAGEPGLPG